MDFTGQSFEIETSESRDSFMEEL